ncbi:hypothetical protein [Oceanibacterium hippocampi]|uniref:Uncharacterized protein n=1 Tax=Oceanibacterium hippocampi TaxID=745714 RepID=A0A1Y5S3P1_9PROT|nr:hypothetical protein [Oceanibacterium hippocampi]SLN31979.1 hypothetical protein OCH7691_01165 [Oceanibacterium hippocampi]
MHNPDSDDPSDLNALQALRAELRQAAMAVLELGLRRPALRSACREIAAGLADLDGDCVAPGIAAREASCRR